MKVTDQYFALVLFIMMYPVVEVLPFDSVGKTLNHDHSNITYGAVL